MMVSGCFQIWVQILAGVPVIMPNGVFLSFQFGISTAGIIVTITMAAMKTALNCATTHGVLQKEQDR